MFRWAPEGISACAFVLPYGRSRNYGMFSTFQTPLVVLLIDLLARGGWRVAEARLIDTLIGPAYACHRHVTGDQSLALVADAVHSVRSALAGERLRTPAGVADRP